MARAPISLQHNAPVTVTAHPEPAAPPAQADAEAGYVAGRAPMALSAKIKATIPAPSLLNCRQVDLQPRAASRPRASPLPWASLSLDRPPRRLTIAFWRLGASVPALDLGVSP